MLRGLVKFRNVFSTIKQQYSKHFIVKFHFKEDGYYQSNQMRLQFVKSLIDLQKSHKAIVLGGDSFPFGITTFFINCDQIQTAQQFVNQNIFVKKGIAEGTLEQTQRISSYKIGNVANFYQIKVNI